MDPPETLKKPRASREPEPPELRRALSALPHSALRARGMRMRKARSAPKGATLAPPAALRRLRPLDVGRGPAVHGGALESAELHQVGGTVQDTSFSCCDEDAWDRR